jgi:predicted aldo/keto reductase-like oxidoreductase
MRFPKIFSKAEELVMRSIEKGVNYFDTAWIYPGNERVLGTILDKNNVRDKVFIATKLPLVLFKGTQVSAEESRVDFDKYFNQSLERLKTDYIDYYMMHMITDMDQWNQLKALGIENWIDQKKKSGQIKQIGFSFHGPGYEFLKIIDDYDWDFCLIQYNYSDENFQAGVKGLRAAAAKMTVITMEPLLGGKLAAGLPKEAVKIFKEACHTQQGGPADLSPAGWALNWVWDQEEVTTVLSGMGNMDQLEENLRLAGASEAGMLTDKHKDVYASVLKSINRSCKINCTGCNYCLPCPFGVNIPGSFSAYNVIYSHGYVEGMKQYITSTGFTSETGSGPCLCNKCGKCELLCPQKIPILKELSKVRRKMEPWWVRCIGIGMRFYMGKKRKKKDV